MTPSEDQLLLSIARKKNMQCRNWYYWLTGGAIYCNICLGPFYIWDYTNYSKEINEHGSRHLKESNLGGFV